MRNNDYQDDYDHLAEAKSLMKDGGCADPYIREAAKVEILMSIAESLYHLSEGKRARR